LLVARENRFPLFRIMLRSAPGNAGASPDIPLAEIFVIWHLVCQKQG
jgi:hypothetical protein